MFNWQLLKPDVIKAYIQYILYPQLKKKIRKMTKKQITKLGFYLLLLIWGFYAYLKNKGLLKKKSIKGQHIFITGAGSGIGRQMAIRL